MVPHVVLDLVVRPVSLFVLEEIGVFGRVEPVGARAKGELALLTAPMETPTKETRRQALRPYRRF